MKINKTVIFVVGAALTTLLSGCTSGIKKNVVVQYSAPQSGYLSVVAPVAVKDFDVKGVIFLQSKVTTDITGKQNGSEITYEMLMREAVKLGADDIINVRIDKKEIAEATDSYEKDQLNDNEVFKNRQYTSKETTYKATALAIKYAKALENARPADIQSSMIKSDTTSNHLDKPVAVMDNSSSAKTRTTTEKSSSVFAGIL